MAVTNEKSAQIAAERLYPVEQAGKVRIAYFDFTQGVAAGDANSTADLCKIPYGRVRILPQMSRISFSAFGASRVLDVGHRAYRGESNADVAEDLDAFATGIDVASADADGVAIGALLKFDMFGRNTKTIAAQVRGGTIPAGATIKGYIAYVHE